MSAVIQRDRALERANEIRSRRFVERRALQALPSTQARERLGRLIVDCPDWLAGMSVHQLVRRAPGVGEATAPRLLALIGVRDFRRAGDLTERQRLALSARLREMSK